MAGTTGSIHLRRALAIGIVGAALLLGACSDDDSGAAPGSTEGDTTEGEAETTEGETTEAETAEAFCARMEELDVEQPETYVGSPQHVEDLDSLLAVAPDPIADAVGRYRDFVASGAITDDPASKETTSWPPEVQDDVGAIQDHATSTC